MRRRTVVTASTGMRKRYSRILTMIFLAIAAIAVIQPAAYAITASTLVNPVSGKCLDGENAANSTQTVLNSCAGGANQL
ncbi:RICIN domain-containing protein [Streptosporangiaceae bacterium NEAU-GS5]|nr:RICIN domain-containing protein [Streptosporangiaceae bacterium NEAU-GS5]